MALKLVVVFIAVSAVSVALPSLSLPFQCFENNPRDSFEPFECGFNPFSKCHPSFYFHFFSICLLFILFDLEVVVILPLLNLNLPLFSWILFWSTLGTILLLGIFMEMYYGTLEWKES